MTARRETFVEFFSPGTLISEISRRPIGSRDVAEAVKLAADITERHGAKPYGFQFGTQINAEPVPDGEGGWLHVKPKEVERSGIHYLGGKVIRYDDVPDDDEHRIMRGNMRCNGDPVCVENNNSWLFTGVFHEDNVIVDDDGQIIGRGNDPWLVEYRRRKLAEWDAEREPVA